MTNTKQSYVYNQLQSPIDRIKDVISSLIIVDIGTITNYNEDGTATVASNTIVGNNKVVYKNVEVLGIGNSNGGIFANALNCSCLLLFPKSPVVDVDSKEVCWTSPSYSKGCIKAIPICNNSGSLMSFNITDTGEMNILGTEYMLSFNKDNIRYVDDGLILSLPSGNELSLYRKTDSSGEYIFTIDDTQVYRSVTATNNVQVEMNISQKDGSVSLTQSTIGEDENQVIQVLQKIDNSGNISFTQYYTKDDTVKEGNIVSLKTTGDITITSKTGTTITIDSNGNLFMSVKGKVSISSSEAVTINDNLEIAKGK